MKAKKVLVVNPTGRVPSVFAACLATNTDPAVEIVTFTGGRPKLAHDVLLEINSCVHTVEAKKVIPDIVLVVDNLGPGVVLIGKCFAERWPRAQVVYFRRIASDSCIDAVGWIGSYVRRYFDSAATGITQ